MISEDKIYIGNKFIGEMNKKLFTIIAFKEDAGNKYVILECEGKKIDVLYANFRHLLLKEVK